METNRSDSTILLLSDACKMINLSVSGYWKRRKKGTEPFPTFKLKGSNRNMVLETSVNEYLTDSFGNVFTQSVSVSFEKLLE